MVPFTRFRIAVGAFLLVAGALALTVAARADHRSRRAVLRDAAGTTVGQIVFAPHRHGVIVTVTVSGLTPGFHGFHIHANNDPANGVGCVAPTFASADGHFDTGGHTHGSHAGDMPVLLAMESGRSHATFVSDRLQLGQLRDRAVIIHAGSNNYGNIPVGALPDQYTPNSPAASTATAATGNAGARVVCGVIE